MYLLFIIFLHFRPHLLTSFPIEIILSGKGMTSFPFVQELQYSSQDFNLLPSSSYIHQLLLLPWLFMLIGLFYLLEPLMV